MKWKWPVRVFRVPWVETRNKFGFSHMPPENVVRASEFGFFGFGFGFSRVWASGSVFMPGVSATPFMQHFILIFFSVASNIESRLKLTYALIRDRE
jgi:hypothetical protein